MALKPYQLAGFGEQLDAIGRKQPLASVRPSGWNVSYTRVVGLLCMLFAIFAIYQIWG